MTWKQYLTVNSKTRRAGTATNFDAAVPPTFFEYDFKRMRVRVIRAQLPYSFLNVPEGRNSFLFIDDGTEVTVTLTAGSYDAFSMRDALNAKFTALGLTGYTWTFDTITGKYTLTHSDSGHEFGIAPYAGEFDLSDNLGFPDEGTDEADGGVLTSTSVVDLSGPDRLYVRCSIVRQENFWNSELSQFTNTIAIIPVDVEPYAIVNYEPLHPIEMEADNAFHKFNLSIVDEHGYELVLPDGHEVFMLLEFTPI